MALCGLQEVEPPGVRVCSRKRLGLTSPSKWGNIRRDCVHHLASGFCMALFDTNHSFCVLPLCVCHFIALSHQPSSSSLALRVVWNQVVGCIPGIAPG